MYIVINQFMSAIYRDRYKTTNRRWCYQGRKPFEKIIYVIKKKTFSKIIIIDTE